MLPHDQSLRPAWMIRIGLFLYDHLGGRKLLPGSKRVVIWRGRLIPAGLKPGHETGFEYSDCWVNDARLVALNAMDARERGAEILTRTPASPRAGANGIWPPSCEAKDGNAAHGARPRRW